MRPPQRPRSSRARARAERRARPSHDRARDGDARTRGEAAHGDEGAPSRRAARRIRPRARNARPSAPSLTPPSSLPSAQAPSEVQAKSVGEVVLAWNQELETRTVRRTPRHPDPASPPLPLPLARAAHPALAPHPPALVSSRAAQNYFASKAKGLAEWDSPSCETGTSSWPSGATTDEPPLAFRAPPARSPDPPPLPPLVRFRTPFPSSTGGSRQGVDVPLIGSSASWTSSRCTRSRSATR